MYKYFIINKPFNVLSQFTSQENKKTLKDFFDVPLDVYPVGRLDYDSEGLLILTNDSQLNNTLLNPLHKHEREYWVQVEGSVTDEAITKMQSGLVININGKLYHTKNCFASSMDIPLGIESRNPPVRFRKNIPDSWIKIILTEGKNRQIRKMTTKAGFPTLRLIRFRIEKVTIENLQLGEMKMLSQTELYNLLQIIKR